MDRPFEGSVSRVVEASVDVELDDGAGKMDRPGKGAKPWAPPFEAKVVVVLGINAGILPNADGDPLGA